MPLGENGELNRPAVARSVEILTTDGVSALTTSVVGMETAVERVTLAAPENPVPVGAGFKPAPTSTSVGGSDGLGASVAVGSGADELGGSVVAVGTGFVGVGGTVGDGSGVDCERATASAAGAGVDVSADSTGVDTFGIGDGSLHHRLHGGPWWTEPQSDPEAPVQIHSRLRSS